MDTLDHAGALELMDRFAGLISLFVCEKKFCLAGTLCQDLDVFVDVAVGVTGHDNGLFPGADIGFDTADKDGGAENCAVQSGTDGRVRALVHCMQIIFLDSGGIGSDCGTFDSDAEPFGRFRSLDSDLIVGLIPLFQAEVVILRLQIDERKKKVIFDHLPDDACHLISVHFNKRCGHSYFLHVSFLLIRSMTPNRVRPCSQRLNPE